MRSQRVRKSVTLPQSVSRDVCRCVFVCVSLFCCVYTRWHVLVFSDKTRRQLCATRHRRLRISRNENTRARRHLNARRANVTFIKLHSMWLCIYVVCNIVYTILYRHLCIFNIHRYEAPYSCVFDVDYRQSSAIKIRSTFSYKNRTTQNAKIIRYALFLILNISNSNCNNKSCVVVCPCQILVM